MGSIRIEIKLKFWDLIHINELFFSEKNDKKWWSIKMKIGSKMVKMGKYKNKNWEKFWVLMVKELGKCKNFFRLKFWGADLCLSWVAPFYTTECEQQQNKN